MVERVIDIVLGKTETAIFLLHQEHDVLGSNPSPATNWQALWGQYNPEEKGTTENCEKTRLETRDSAFEVRKASYKIQERR